MGWRSQSNPGFMNAFLDLFLVLGTWALVGVTLWMAHHHARLFREQLDFLRNDFRNDLRARLQLTFAERFDSDRMKSHRRVLAEQLRAGAVHEKIQEDVMNFFEDMDLFLGHGYLEEDLLWSIFGFYAVRWWALCKNYIFEERRRKNDTTLFTGFKDLVDRFAKRDAQEGLEEPTAKELEEFLHDEIMLHN